MRWLLALALAGALGVSGAQAATTAEEAEKWLLDAREHIQKGALEAAVIDLKNALQQDPRNAEARLLLGQLYADLGQGLPAEKELRAARELGIGFEQIVVPLGRALLLQRRFAGVLEEINTLDLPKELTYDILLIRADATAGLGQLEETIDLLNAAAKRRPDDPRAPLGVARVFAAQNRHDNAAKKVEEALAVAPDNVEALMLKADLRRMTGDPEGSLTDYARVLELQPESAEARLGQAASLLTLGRDDEAKSEIDAVLQDAPDNPMARYMHAHVLIRDGDLEGAEAVLKEIAPAMERFPPAYWLNGIVEYAQGNYETARSWLERYMTAQPGNLEARKLLGATLIRLNAADDAIEVLAPAREAAPEDPQLMALLGSAFLQAGRHSEAVEQLESAERLVPEDAELLSRLALGQLATGETGKAEATFGSALDLGLENSAVGHLIAMNHLNAGRFDEALALAKQLQARFPDSPLPHNLESAAHAGRQDIPQARAALEAALRLEPGMATARLNMASLDLREGKYDEASAIYKSVLQDDEGNIIAMSGLAELAQRQGRGEEALEWRRKAHEVDSAALAPGLAYVGALSASGDNEAATAVIKRMRAANPDQPELLSALGGVQLAEEKHKEAIASFTRLVEVTDGLPAARIRLAQAYQAAGETERARSELEAMARVKPVYPPAVVALSGLVAASDGIDAALALARPYAESDPERGWGHRLIGDLLMQNGRAAEAVPDYEAAWAKERSSNLAIALYRARSAAGQGEAALTSLQEWLEQAPQDQLAQTALAEAYMRLGRIEDARETYWTLVEAETGNATVWNNLAWLSFEAGDERALELAERALLLEPGRPEIMDTLAWIQLQSGETSQALRLLKQATESAPDQPDIAYHYAVALHRSGRSAEAEPVLRRALETDQPFASAAEAEALLKEVLGN